MKYKRLFRGGWKDASTRSHAGSGPRVHESGARIRNNAEFRRPRSQTPPALLVRPLAGHPVCANGSRLMEERDRAEDVTSVGEVVHRPTVPSG